MDGATYTKRTVVKKTNEKQVDEQTKQIAILKDAVAVIGTDEGKTALQKFCWLKRMEAAMKKMQAMLCKEANDDFEKLRVESAQLTRWPLEGFAVLTNNAAPGSWQVPEDFMLKQAELDNELAKFKAAHPENYTSGVLDPDLNVLFKVTIMA